MNKIYQLYSVTNILNNRMYIAHSIQRVDPHTKYFSTNKALYDDLKKYGIKFFNKTVICEKDNLNDIKKSYRQYLVDSKRNGIELYNDMCSYGYIYLTTNNLNGMKYIGQHRVSGCPRLDDNYFGSGTIIGMALKKIGIENFTKEILEECDSEDKLNEQEKYWIKKYNAVKDPNFYNIAEGGEFGDIWSGKSAEEKQRFSERIAESNKNRKRDVSRISGDKNPAFGKHWYKDELNHIQYYLYPDDILIKELQLVRGMFRTKEHNLKISASNKGKCKKYSPNKGKIAVNDGKHDKYVNAEDVQEYIDVGYKLGGASRKTKGKVQMNNGIKNVLVSKKDVQDYINIGYNLGYIHIQNSKI